MTTSEEAKYCVDTSTLIEAWLRYYPPISFPSLWNKLDGLINAKKLLAPSEVLEELKKKADEIYAWAKRREHMFVPIENGVIQQSVRNVLARYPKLLDTRKNRSGADPWVIALAITQNLTVVTYEIPSRSPSRPKIPDVCSALRINCIDLVKLIEEQGWTF